MAYICVWALHLRAVNHSSDQEETDLEIHKSKLHRSQMGLAQKFSLIIVSKFINLTVWLKPDL